MEVDLKDNNILKVLHQIFSEYTVNGNDCISKIDLFKLLFEYNIIDICGFNLFHINNFMKQLNPTDDVITLRMFLILIFYIYSHQVKLMKNAQQEKQDAKLEFAKKKFEKPVQENILVELSQEPKDVSEISVENINAIVSNHQQIFGNNNVIKILLNRKEKGEIYFQLCSPCFNDGNKDLCKIFSHDVLDFLSLYQSTINTKIFSKYSILDESKNVSYINIDKINTMLFDLPFFANFNCDTIASFMKLFLHPHVVQSDDEAKWNILKSIFDEKLPTGKIKDLFISLFIDSNNLNFSFSSLVAIMSLFALNLKSSQGKLESEAIQFFFEEELGLTKDYVEIPAKIEETVEEPPDEDYLPESEMIGKAKQMRDKPGKEENDFLQEMLGVLDKTLPEEDPKIKIKAFANEIADHSNKIFYHKMKPETVKFPLQILEVEINEQRERAEELRVKARIDAAKKIKKRNPRDPIPKEEYYEEMPNKQFNKEKYYGLPKTESLKYRLLKNTMKDILVNSNVYPSLIREILIIPHSLPSKIKETVVFAFKDQVQGNNEMSIRRLEKAKTDLETGYKFNDFQIDLFFNLSFGSLYESLDLDIMALRFFHEARNISDKLQPVDPDIALAYCYLGAIFLKLKEFDWSLRCFLKAKEVREHTIGGDTLDTATVYNNLGVLSYHLQSYLPARGYFQLSYEIYKSFLGVNHPRTLLIKSNLSKLSQLDFNKPVELKSLGIYPTPYQMVPNPKRLKKK